MRTLLILSLLAAVAGVLAPAAAQEPSAEGDTVVIDPDASTIEVAVALSQVAFPDDGADVVLIGRDDLFADSLASGVAQDEGPLLLVPTNGPVPAPVRAEIQRLGAGRAVLFGGESAVSEAVADELRALDLTVERRSGASRIETAVVVAQADGAGATTAILARAGGVEGNPTSGFADALAAGGWAAATGWPVLLTQTEVLTGSTRDFLAGSAITEVKVMGGTAAVSDAVVSELQSMDIAVDRVAGPDRAATAVETAKARGAESAADVASAIVVDGFSEDAWAAGFAAAALSARGVPAVPAGFAQAGDGAPIVLGNVDSLPPATQEWLVPGPERIACALTPAVCDAARVEVGFDPTVTVEVPVGALVYGTAVGDRGQVRGGAFDGTDLGFVYTCPDGPCGEMDWTERGDVLALVEPGAAGSFFRVEDRLLVNRQRSTVFDDIQDVIDLSEVPDDPDFLFHTTFGQCTGQPFSAGGGCGGGATPIDRSISTLQSLAAHAGAVGAEQGTTALYRNDDGRMLLVTIRSFEGFEDQGEPAQIQVRPGAQLIGAALDPAGSGDVALVDAIAGIATLRIAPWPDGDVLMPDIRPVSDPYWLPGGDTVVVMADDGGTTQLVAVDATTGAVEVLVEDAGTGIAERIEADASGTLIAWRTRDVVRVLNTGDGSVAEITPPDGHTITAGPSFRPSA